MSAGCWAFCFVVDCCEKETYMGARCAGVTAAIAIATIAILLLLLLLLPRPPFPFPFYFLRRRFLWCFVYCSGFCDRRDEGRSTAAKGAATQHSVLRPELQSRIRHTCTSRRTSNIITKKEPAYEHVRNDARATSTRDQSMTVAP